MLFTLDRNDISSVPLSFKIMSGFKLFEICLYFDEKWLENTFIYDFY